MTQAFLKCDADGCTHTETVPGISEDLIGKPCPICGASLLTEGDYRQWMEAVAPGVELEPHIDRIVKEAQARFPEYGEIML